MYQIITSQEQKRGCGYRKPGGFYFVAGKSARPCAKLPIEVSICPCCSQGIQFNRGFTWVSSVLIEQQPCRLAGCSDCFPFKVMKRYGLMWVGEKFYKTPAAFSAEAAKMGVSKRLPFIPKGFTIGVDWILLAHRKCPFETENGIELKPGIFTAFCPSQIDYIVKGDESDDFLNDLYDKGVRLIDVIPEGESEQGKIIPLHPELQ
ncbi:MULTISPECIES: hypothetical protein [Larkinella]|jgi:hypothetical protein|uniref:Uncharacterized protein n=1 Tax=Larkinella punicea TaxID=2315727 RepID=A0A368JHD2_9BACT|nr:MULTISPECIES: hypothetical protein [Larkinella]RCR67079.1 hypothetical protein DUE52_23780 [Larkinella punicea]